MWLNIKVILWYLNPDKLTFWPVIALQGGTDTCEGDSGGALACNGYLCGVVNYGYGCGFKNYPSVYTSIPAFADWITANAKKIN